ncbi:MAG: class I SAM-dependent methyltransferase [Actinomycetota bacterium]
MTDRTQPAEDASGSPDGIGYEAERAAIRANWDARVPVHLGPDGYGIDRLAGDPAAISAAVGFDRPYLGDLSGLLGVHLQCHLGTDTLSLARLGASMTGLDFSPAAVEAARGIVARCGADVDIVEGDVYRAPELLGRTFDLVYTGVGAINWLPDLTRWAEVAAALLRPGGRFHLTEGHPMLMTLDDDSRPDRIILTYPYFDGAPTMRFDEPHSYVGSGTVASPEQYEWAHHPASVVQALIDAGLVLDRFEEHRVLPWQAFPWMEPVPDRPEYFALPSPLDQCIPASFTVQAHRPG